MSSSNAMSSSTSTSAAIGNPASTLSPTKLLCSVVDEASDSDDEPSLVLLSEFSDAVASSVEPISLTE
jgi:hypothetical protein